MKYRNSLGLALASSFLLRAGGQPAEAPDAAPAGGRNAAVRHRMYLNTPSRLALKEDLARFIRSSVPPE
jgi:hypothetical protein